jgi:hypothetical protein
MPDVESILRSTAVPDSVKADAWDAYHAATSVDDLATRLKKLPITDAARADLWDAKHAEAPNATEPATPKPAAKGIGEQIGDFVSHTASGLNPVNIISGAKDLVNAALTASPAQTAKNLNLDSSAAQKKIVDAVKSGKYVEAARHLVGLLPIVGPQLDQMGDDAQAGNVGAALGDATAFSALTAGAPTIAKGGRAVARGAKTAGSAVAEVAADIPVKDIVGMVSPRAAHAANVVAATGPIITKLRQNIAKRTGAPARDVIGPVEPPPAPMGQDIVDAANAASDAKLAQWMQDHPEQPAVAPQLKEAAPVAAPVQAPAPAPVPAEAVPVAAAPPEAVRPPVPESKIDIAKREFRARKDAKAAGLPAPAPAPRSVADLSQELNTSLGQPVPETAQPPVDFAAAPRDLKAQALATYLHETGTTHASALQMDPRKWGSALKDVAAALDGVDIPATWKSGKPPSPSSVKAALAELKKLEDAKAAGASDPVATPEPGASVTQGTANPAQAQALAKFVYAEGNGIPHSDALRMSPEQWKTAAKGAGLDAPSPATQKLVLDMLHMQELVKQQPGLVQ